MTDRLYVSRALDVTPVTGDALDDLKTRLALMEREVRHLATAVGDMKNGIATNNSRLLTSGVMNSRNWAASVVMSHAYIQTLLGANPGQNDANSYLIARFHLYDLFKRAAETGANDAIATRKRLNVRPTGAAAQVDWDGTIR